MIDIAARVLTFVTVGFAAFGVAACWNAMMDSLARRRRRIARIERMAKKDNLCNRCLVELENDEGDTDDE